MRYYRFLNIIFVIGLLLYPGALYAEMNSLTLKEAIDLALSDNLHIRFSEYEREKRKFEYRSKSAELLPQVKGFGYYSTGEVPLGDIEEDWYAGIRLTQPIFRGGSLRNNKLQYKNFLKQKDLELELKKLHVALEVKQAFAEVIKCEELARATKETVEVLKRHYLNVNEMYKQGLIPSVEVLKTKSRLKKAEIDYESNVNLIYVAKSNLNYIINRPLEEEYDLIYPEEAYDVPFTVSEAGKLALEYRPELGVLGIDKENHILREKIVKSRFYPWIDAFGRFDKDTQDDFPAAGVEFNINLWDSGKTINDLKAAQYRYKEISTEEEILTKRVELEGREAYLYFDSALKRIEAMRRLCESAREDLDKEIIRFKNGQADNEDVLDAQLIWSEAKVALKAAEANYYVRKAVLERAIGVVSIEQIPYRPERFESDWKLLEFLEYRSFLYFMEEQSLRSGLFRDTSGGGDASIAATGFGLTCLCLGVENGWISKEDAEARILKCLSTLLTKTERKYGFFYHFLEINTGQRAGESEVSTIDTALLVCGLITAEEYFQGEVKEKAGEIIKSIEWHKMVSKDHQLYMGWTPEEGMMERTWDYYTDEALIIALIALGSDKKVPADVFYSFIRNSGKYKDYPEFIYSWQGALFTYQYANLWFNFQNLKDKERINWYENSKKAVRSHIAYCRDNAEKYRSFNENSWGVSSCNTKDRYTMMMGLSPCGEINPKFDGTVSIAGSVATVIFTPYEAIEAAKEYYKRPELWGRYGLKNSFNDDKDWVSELYFGLDRGLLVIAIENFRTGLVWDFFNNAEIVQKGFKRAGLSLI